MFYEFIKFIIYSSIIVLTSKFILVSTIRKLAKNLNLKPKKVGDISGYATSIPELLTIIASSINGLEGASIYNILSSNVINFLQYIFSIISNKNLKFLNNIALKIEIVLVLFTIIFPIILITKNIEITIKMTPILILLFILFTYINNNAHKIYLKKFDKEIEENIKKEEEIEYKNTRKTLLYILILIFAGIILYVTGDLLGETLQILANKFNISQKVIGILLGITTSIPELITFFESQKHYKNDKQNILGVVEATNNLLTSNSLNLFIIQTLAILISSVF